MHLRLETHRDTHPSTLQYLDFGAQFLELLKDTTVLQAIKEIQACYSVGQFSVRDSVNRSKS